MKLQLDDITAEAKDLVYAEDAADLNTRLASGVAEYRVAGDVGVAITYYRAGLDVYLSGTLHGDLSGVCARCAEEFSFSLDAPVRLVLAPRSTEGGHDGQLGADDLALSFFAGKEIDLAPIVHEQMILALPTRPLCAESCQGLCPRCGINRNTETCRCSAADTSPRLAVLQDLVRGK